MVGRMAHPRCRSVDRDRYAYVQYGGTSAYFMTTHLVTFSDDSMSRSARLCVESAMPSGIHQTHWSTPDSLRELPYFAEHQKLFNSPRGCGYWAWKAALLDRALNDEHEAFLMNVREGDILIYADAGIEFINSVNYIIDRMDQDIFLFGNNWEHAHWCKRDVINEICTPSVMTAAVPGKWSNDAVFDRDGLCWDFFGKQVQASVIFFRVSQYTKAFVREWLKWCLFEDGRLIDDSPSRNQNHPEFREHRHDQAILTTLAYREGIKLHYWPASYNDGAFTYEKLPEYASDDYPILFNHHRKRNHEWSNAA